MTPSYAIVPATAANLGPGYDCLGIALQIYNTVELQPGVGGEPHPMVEGAADAFFASTGIPKEPFAWRIHGDVPVSRGLGSSVTLRLGVIEALNRAFGGPLDRERVYRLCANLEGHPDNAAPAQFGGFVVALPDARYCRFEVSDELFFVLLVPGFEILTDMARTVLPASVGHGDAACNVAHAAMLTAAFASGDYDKLAGAFEDALHQPYRKTLLPGMEKVIEAGESAGAYGGFLSGSGSTIACVTRESPEAVAIAMRKAMPEGDAETMVVRCDNRGAVSGAMAGVE